MLTRVANTQDGRTGDLYAGFESYCTPVQADYEHLFSGGMIVVDANVLLDLYLYHGKTRDEFMRVLEKLRDRIWVPHQVVKEFWKNRDSKLRDPRESDAASRDLESRSAEAVNKLRAWSNRVRMPRADVDRLADTLSQAFKTVIDEVKKLGADDGRQFARNTSSDPLLLGLAPLLKGRVGPPLSEKEYGDAVTEALRRIDKELPPGYADAKKEDKNAVGDYLIWVQILREAKTRQQDVLFVTSDNKEDWWRKDDNKDKDKRKSLGPRPELADELMQRSGKRLFMLPPERLLDWARTVLKDIEVSDESVQDVKQVSGQKLKRDDVTADALWFVDSELSDYDRAQLGEIPWNKLRKFLAIAAAGNRADREIPNGESRDNAVLAWALLAAMSDPALQKMDPQEAAAFKRSLARSAIEIAAREQARGMGETGTSDSVPAETAADG
jgi:predicted nucleic acid-binding protein